MLFFKNKIKTKTTYEIKVRNKKNNVLRNTAITMVLSLIGLHFFAGMKVYNIENIISYNKTVIASISNNNDAAAALFSKEYTNEMFRKDLKNFELINIKNEKTTGMYPFQEITILQKYKPTTNTEEYLSSIKKENSNIASKQVKLSERLPYVLLRFGFTPVSQYIYPDLNRAFKNKYNNNSFFDTFIMRSSFINEEYDNRNSEAKADFDKKDKEITKKLKIAYDNKDYKTLELYFKQFHEYIDYIGSFKHTPISVSAIKEYSFSDSVISYGAFEKYIKYKSNKEDEKPEDIQKDIVLSTF